MSKFHINPKTGNPGICRAENSCPFGDLATDHYDTKEKAREAFEGSMEAGNIPSFIKATLNDAEQLDLQAKVVTRAANRKKRIQREEAEKQMLEFIKRDSARRAAEKSKPKKPAKKTTFTQGEVDFKLKMATALEKYENIEKVDTTYYPHQAGSFGDFLARREQVIEGLRMVEQKMNKNASIFSDKELRDVEFQRWKAEAMREVVKLSHYRQYVKKSRGVWASKNDYDVPEENYKAEVVRAIENAPKWISDEKKADITKVFGL